MLNFEQWCSKNGYVPKRFRPDGTQTKICDIYGNYTYKDNFQNTRTYSKYLKYKNQEETKLELEKLKQKLEYEYKTYGEVDKIDLDRFEQLVKLGY